MDDKKQLDAIKTRLSITGTYHDGLLMEYADDVKAYMVSAGVLNRIVNDEKAIGCIARGVADLWNYGAGDGKFSEVFYQRVIQLALPMSKIEDGLDEYDVVTKDDINNIVGDGQDSEFATKEDIDNVVDGEHEPEDKEESEDGYDYADKEDIDGILNGDDDTEIDSVTKEDIDNIVGEDEYDYATKEDIDGLFKTS